MAEDTAAPAGITAPSPLLKGRDCGDCTLCCKVMRINALEKPKGEWCGHCIIGKGCQTYDTRPSECREFYCGYLTTPLPPEWRTDRSLQGEEYRSAGSSP